MRAGETASAEIDVVQPQIAGADAKLIGRVRQLVNDRAAVLFAVPDRGSRESLELRLNDEGIPFVESLGSAAENSVPVTDPAAMRNRFFNPNLAGGALLDIGVYSITLARLFLESCPGEMVSLMAYQRHSPEQL